MTLSSEARYAVCLACGFWPAEWAGGGWACPACQYAFGPHEGTRPVIVRRPSRGPMMGLTSPFTPRAGRCFGCGRESAWIYLVRYLDGEGYVPGSVRFHEMEALVCPVGHLFAGFRSDP